MNLLPIFRNLPKASMAGWGTFARRCPLHRMVFDHYHLDPTPTVWSTTL